MARYFNRWLQTTGLTVNPWRARPATIIGAVVFFLIAIVQLLRIILHVRVVANGVALPLWPSIVAFAIALILAVLLWRESRL
jgi:membrane protein implicated in regulation of membrane protease activity